MSPLDTLGQQLGLFGVALVIATLIAALLLTIYRCDERLNPRRKRWLDRDLVLLRENPVSEPFGVLEVKLAR